MLFRGLPWRCDSGGTLFRLVFLAVSQRNPLTWRSEWECSGISSFPDGDGSLSFKWCGLVASTPHWREIDNFPCRGKSLVWLANRSVERKSGFDFAATRLVPSEKLTRQEFALCRIVDSQTQEDIRFGDVRLRHSARWHHNFIDSIEIRRGWGAALQERRDTRAGKIDSVFSQDLFHTPKQVRRLLRHCVLTSGRRMTRLREVVVPSSSRWIKMDPVTR